MCKYTVVLMTTAVLLSRPVIVNIAISKVVMCCNSVSGYVLRYIVSCSFIVVVFKVSAEPSVVFFDGCKQTFCLCRLQVRRICLRCQQSRRNLAGKVNRTHQRLSCQCHPRMSLFQHRRRHAERKSQKTPLQNRGVYYNVVVIMVFDICSALTVITCNSWFRFVFLYVNIITSSKVILQEARSSSCHPSWR